MILECMHTGKQMYQYVLTSKKCRFLRYDFTIEQIDAHTNDLNIITRQYHIMNEPEARDLVTTCFWMLLLIIARYSIQ